MNHQYCYNISEFCAYCIENNDDLGDRNIRFILEKYNSKEVFDEQFINDSANRFLLYLSAEETNKFCSKHNLACC